MDDTTFDPRARRRRVILRLLRLPAALLALLLVAYFVMISMPGKSYRGALPAMTEDEKALEAELRTDVTYLAGTIGVRNVSRHSNLQAAAEYLREGLKRAGFDPESITFTTDDRDCEILQVSKRGARAPEEIVLVGAHYDSAPGAPGANDNGSGTAAVLALARRLANKSPARTIELVLWPNEEPPYFQTQKMGSLVHAKRAKERGERIVAMMSIETIGYYSDEEGSQKYPFPFGLFYPSRGDFIGFVGNVGSRALVRRAIGSFRDHASFPSEGAAAPGSMPGIGWSDHWAYWEQGYEAVMVTDTAPFRYPYYHTLSDRPEKLDYGRMARVVAGLEAVVDDLAK